MTVLGITRVIAAVYFLIRRPLSAMTGTTVAVIIGLAGCRTAKAAPGDTSAAPTTPPGTATPAVDTTAPALSEVDSLATWRAGTKITSPAVAGSPAIVVRAATEIPFPRHFDPAKRADSSYITSREPRVLIVSVDGLRPDCMLRADAPTFRSLMAKGSFTMYARTTDIAITTPSHVSMVTGVTPERHGISFNGDPPEDARILVPTLFDYAKQYGLSTAMVSGKRKFSLFTQTGSLDHSAISVEPLAADAAVGEWASEIVAKDRPRVMLVHFPGADSAGHGIGWGTPEQLKAIATIDHALAAVIDTYKKLGIAKDTYVIVTADHGGTGRSHGKDDPRSRYIPWIFVGPGVRVDFDLTRLGKDKAITTFDTFATACYILGIPVPADSDGKPVLEAFSDFELIEPSAAAAATAPATGR